MIPRNVPDPKVEADRCQKSAVGRVAEAIRQVRSDGPSGKDSADTVPASAIAAGPPGPAPGGIARNIRSAGFQPLLGAFPQGKLGGQTQDGPEPLYAGSHPDCPMVPHPPAPSDRRATPDTQPEATRAFCLLWDHGQQHCASPVSAGGAAHSGGNGLVVNVAGTGPPGPSSCNSSSAGRCRHRLPYIPCAVCEAKGLLEEPYAVVLHVRVCGSPG